MTVMSLFQFLTFHVQIKGYLSGIQPFTRFAKLDEVFQGLARTFPVRLHRVMPQAQGRVRGIASLIVISHWNPPAKPNTPQYNVPIPLPPHCLT